MSEQEKRTAKEPDRQHRSCYPRVLSDVLPTVTKVAMFKHGLSSSRLVNEWRAIVSPLFADECYPLQLGRPHEGKGGLLTIKIRPGFALTFQHLQPIIIERINSHFGYRAVARIRLIQGPISRPTPKQPMSLPPEQPEFDTHLQKIGDKELRSSLRRLGQFIVPF